MRVGQDILVRACVTLSRSTSSSGSGVDICSNANSGGEKSAFSRLTAEEMRSALLPPFAANDRRGACWKAIRLLACAPFETSRQLGPASRSQEVARIQRQFQPSENVPPRGCGCSGFS